MSIDSLISLSIDEIDILHQTVVRKTLYSMMTVMDLYLKKLSYCFQLASNHIIL